MFKKHLACLVLMLVSVLVYAQSGTVYLTANLQGNTMELFNMPMIVSRPNLLIPEPGNIEVKGDDFFGNSFSTAVGYHLSERIRMDLGYTRYTAKSEDDATFLLLGSGYIARHTIQGIDIPLKVYYNLRDPASQSRWIWHLLSSVSYTSVQWKRAVDVVNHQQVTPVREERNYDNLFVGVGAGVRVRLTKVLEPYYHFNLSLGTLQGAFKANGVLGLKLNLNAYRPSLDKH